MTPMESMAANDERLGQEDISHRGYQTFGTQEQSVAGIQQEQETGNQQTSSSDRPPVTQQTGSTNRQGTSDNPKQGLKRVKSFYTPYMEDKLCRKLKFFFMGPHEKIKAKRKCPWKLLIQIMKIILVTAQVINILVMFR